MPNTATQKTNNYIFIFSLFSLLLVICQNIKSYVATPVPQLLDQKWLLVFVYFSLKSINIETNTQKLQVVLLIK